MEESKLNVSIDTQETVGISIASDDAVQRGHTNCDDESSAGNSRSSIDGSPTKPKPEVKPVLNDSIDTQETVSSCITPKDIVPRGSTTDNDESSAGNSRSSVGDAFVFSGFREVVEDRIRRVLSAMRSAAEPNPEVKPVNESADDGIEIEIKPDQTLFVDSTENNLITIDDDSKRELGSTKANFVDKPNDQTKSYRLFLEDFVKKNVRLIVAIAAALIVIAILAASLGKKGSTTQDNEMNSVQFPFFNGTEEIDTFASMFLDKTESPTKIPTLAPSTLDPTVSKLPTRNPSPSPSAAPSTSAPSFAPSTAAPSVSYKPTISTAPTVAVSQSPSLSPTGTPTSSPTHEPTETPTSSPTNEPTETPTSSPTNEPTMPVPIVPLDEEKEKSVLNFCVIADAPYTEEELKALPNQIATQMEGCEFLVHLGDIFAGDTACDIGGYEAIQKIMLKSRVPTFVVPGDNEWNDCFRSKIDVGWSHWANHFIGFENNWKHDLSIVRQPGYEENFYFVQKRTLVVGLNIVGGRLHNATEWRTRHLSEFNWVREVMMENLMNANEADGVILMAHAKPKDNHADFFGRLRGFIRDDLQNEFPVLYLHGDGHAFMHTTNYFNQRNFLRIQHEGGTIQPVLKIKAGPGRGPGGRSSVHDAFQYDRQLHLMGQQADINDEKDNEDKEKDDKTTD